MGSEMCIRDRDPGEQKHQGWVGHGHDDLVPQLIESSRKTGERFERLVESSGLDSRGNQCPVNGWEGPLVILDRHLERHSGIQLVGQGVNDLVDLSPESAGGGFQSQFEWESSPRYGANLVVERCEIRECQAWVVLACHEPARGLGSPCR